MTRAAATRSPITLLNAGSRWDRADGLRLLLDGAAQRAGWGPAEVPVPVPVGVGQVATCPFDLVAPDASSSYRRDWMLVDIDGAVIAHLPASLTVTDARCIDLARIIGALPAEIADLQRDLADAAPGEKGAIRRQITELACELKDARAQSAQLGCTQG